MCVKRLKSLSSSSSIVFNGILKFSHIKWFLTTKPNHLWLVNEESVLRCSVDYMLIPFETSIKNFPATHLMNFLESDDNNDMKKKGFEMRATVRPLFVTTTLSHSTGQIFHRLDLNRKMIFDCRKILCNAIQSGNFLFLGTAKISNRPQFTQLIVLAVRHISSIRYVAFKIFSSNEYC